MSGSHTLGVTLLVVTHSYVSQVTSISWNAATKLIEVCQSTNNHFDFVKYMYGEIKQTLEGSGSHVESKNVGSETLTNFQIEISVWELRTEAMGQ